MYVIITNMVSSINALLHLNSLLFDLMELIQKKIISVALGMVQYLNYHLIASKHLKILEVSAAWKPTSPKSLMGTISTTIILLVRGQQHLVQEQPHQRLAQAFQKW